MPVAVKVTTAVHWPGSVLASISDGQVVIGLSESLTVTLKLQLALLPEASVAVQVMVLVPLAKLEPLGGTHATLTPGQLSLAVGAKLTIALH